MANPRFNKQVANSRKALRGGGMGGRTGDMMFTPCPREIKKNAN